MAASMRDSSTPSRQINKVIRIHGTKASTYNAQLLVSSGVPSFDNIIGGGIAVGTVVLIESDVFTSYSDVLLRCYLAEGVTVGHGLLVAAANDANEHILKKLPVQLKEAEGAVQDAFESLGSTRDQSLKIAWQYERLPALKSAQLTPHFGHQYDLSKTANKEELNSSKIETFNALKCSDENCSVYDQLLNSIKNHVVSNGYGTQSPPNEKSTILRLAFQSVGSPLWDANSVSDSASSNAPFCRFLFRLRGLMRSSLATCMLTVPVHLFEDGFTRDRIEKLCDTVIRLESFADSLKETNPIYKDYQGLFHVIKIPTLNSLRSLQPISYDFGFKLRRKKFVVETLHLPPEISRIPTKRQDESDLKSVSCMKTVGRVNLDF